MMAKETNKTFDAMYKVALLTLILKADCSALEVCALAFVFLLFSIIKSSMLSIEAYNEAFLQR
jgi:hypothetical protein